MLDDAQLAQMFLRKGLIDKETLETAKKKGAEQDISLYSVLLENEMVNEERAVVAVSKHLNLHCVSLREFEANPEILELVPYNMARELRLMPLGLTEEDGDFKLYVAMANPLDLDAIEKIGSETEYPVTPLLAGPVDVDQAIGRSYAELNLIDGDGSSGDAGEGGGDLNAGLGDVLDGLFEGGLTNFMPDSKKDEDKKKPKKGDEKGTLGAGFSLDLDLDLNVGGKKDKKKPPPPPRGRHTRATLPSGTEIPEAAMKGKGKEGNGKKKDNFNRPTLPAGTEIPESLKKEASGFGEKPDEGFDRKPTSPGTQAVPPEAIAAASSSAESSGFGDWSLDFSDDPDLADDDDIGPESSNLSNSSMGRRFPGPSATSRSENSSIRYVADPNLKRKSDAFPANIPVSDLIWATVRLLVKKGILTEEEIKEEIKKKRGRGGKRR